jgi:hypothetical protein
MTEDSYQEVDPDADAQAHAGAERRTQQEGADLESGDDSLARSAELSGSPVNVEQEIRRLRGF